MLHHPQLSNGNDGISKGKKNKPKQTTTFKKKKNKENGGYFVCGSTDHWANKCPNRKGKEPHQQKSTNILTSARETPQKKSTLYVFGFPIHELVD